MRIKYSAPAPLANGGAGLSAEYLDGNNREGAKSAKLREEFIIYSANSASLRELFVFFAPFASSRFI
jgi:hypothetical protein